MEYLVEFDINVPEDVFRSQRDDRLSAERSATSTQAAERHLVRLWNAVSLSGDTKVVGLYRAERERELDELLRELPLAPSTHPSVFRLQSHPGDPGALPVWPPLPPDDDGGQ